ncbi:hypothetical protein HK405_007725 [Cladochytrium tenue]|nr:hypothetical protein HK405_007725 [Cladochytrium tenue]
MTTSPRRSATPTTITTEAIRAGVLPPSQQQQQQQVPRPQGSLPLAQTLRHQSATRRPLLQANQSDDDALFSAQFGGARGRSEPILRPPTSASKIGPADVRRRHRAVFMSEDAADADSASLSSEASFDWECSTVGSTSSEHSSTPPGTPSAACDTAVMFAVAMSSKAPKAISLHARPSASLMYPASGYEASDLSPRRLPYQHLQLDNEAESLRLQVLDMNRKLSETEKRLSVSQVQSEGRISLLHDTVKSLREDVALGRRQLAEMRATERLRLGQIETMETAAWRLARELDDRRRECAALRARLDERDAADTALAIELREKDREARALAAAAAALDADVRALVAENASLEARVATLSARIEVSEGQVSELSASLLQAHDDAGATPADIAPSVTSSAPASASPACLALEVRQAPSVADLDYFSLASTTRPAAAVHVMAPTPPPPPPASLSPFWPDSLETIPHRRRDVALRHAGNLERSRSPRGHIKARASSPLTTTDRSVKELEALISLFQRELLEARQVIDNSQNELTARTLKEQELHSWVESLQNELAAYQELNLNFDHPRRESLRKSRSSQALTLATAARHVTLDVCRSPVDAEAAATAVTQTSASTEDGGNGAGGQVWPRRQLTVAVLRLQRWGVPLFLYSVVLWNAGAVLGPAALPEALVRLLFASAAASLGGPVSDLGGASPADAYGAVVIAAPLHAAAAAAPLPRAGKNQQQQQSGTAVTAAVAGPGAGVATAVGVRRGNQLGPGPNKYNVAGMAAVFADAPRWSFGARLDPAAATVRNENPSPFAYNDEHGMFAKDALACTVSGRFPAKAMKTPGPANYIMPDTLFSGPRYSVTGRDVPYEGQSYLPALSHLT